MLRAAVLASLCGVVGAACGDDSGPSTADGGDDAALDAGDDGALDTSDDGGESDAGDPDASDASDATDAGDAGPLEQGVAIDLRFLTDAERSCTIASPVLWVAQDGTRHVITITLDGIVRSFDPDTGDELWRETIPAPEGQTPIAMPTPLVVDDLLVLAWSLADTGEGLPNQGSWRKRSHNAGVIDLTTGTWHPDFPSVQFTAREPAWDGGEVVFDASKVMPRSRIVYLPDGDDGHGLAYVSLGIGGGGQAYHGWMFELDLDAWQAGTDADAVSGILLTSADNDCAYDNGETLFAEVCGAGVWSPAGPVESTDLEGNPELIVPTGNGRVHPGRQSYAHGLLRVQPGLDFDAQCDETACADFDETDPDPACLETCANWFVPRLPPGQTWEPEHGQCDGETFMECYGTLDADFGGSSPVEITLPNSGRRVLAQPAKDGALYLIDREFLGIMHDRLQLIETCGTATDTCAATWAGQFITQPVVFNDEQTGDVLVIVSGFNFDNTHPAGVVAVRVVDGDTPSLEVAWQAPDFDLPEAVDVFRRHTGRPVLHRVGDETYVFVVEPGDPGRMWIIRARDGQIAAITDLQTWGARYVLPLIVDETMYITTCSDNGGLADGRLEAYDIVLTEGGEPVEPVGGNTDINDARCEPGGTVCADTEYCERQVCGGPGLCLPRPDACPDETAEVCGCDGETYASACEANRAGMHVAREGACP